MSVVGFAEGASLTDYNSRLVDDDWRRHDVCPACRSRRIRALSQIRNVRYERCRDCGLSFANPTPPDGVLAEFYNSAYYNNYRICERERLRSDPYFSISTAFIPVIADWVKDRASDKVLDFGCGPGSFLAYLRDKHGFSNLYGVELNRESAAIAWQAHGLRVATDMSGLDGQRFDLIALIEVIEHMSDLEGTMRTLDRLLAPGGRLLITTDEISNPGSRFLPAWAPHFSGPSHLSLFTEKALETLLRRFGFEIEKKLVARSDAFLGDGALAPFYRLDFVSPTSSAEPLDHYYVPTALGRVLGFRPGRRPALACRLLRRADRLVAKALRSLRLADPREHQLVLARRIASEA